MRDNLTKKDENINDGSMRPLKNNITNETIMKTDGSICTIGIKEKLTPSSTD